MNYAGASGTDRAIQVGTMATLKVRSRHLWVWSLGVVGVPLFGLLCAIPWAMSEKEQQRLEREQRIFESTQTASAQMEVAKEVRRMAIRHKPRHVPAHRSK